jgi:hypothetical protein
MFKYNGPPLGFAEFSNHCAPTVEAFPHVDSFRVADDTSRIVFYARPCLLDFAGSRNRRS